MADLDNKLRTTPVQLFDETSELGAEIILEDGQRKLIVQSTISPDDFRLMITYQARLLKKLEEIKEILKEIGD